MVLGGPVDRDEGKKERERERERESYPWISDCAISPWQLALQLEAPSHLGSWREAGPPDHHDDKVDSDQ